MNIPVFSDAKFVKDDGFLTPDMQMYNDRLNQALQNGLSDSGWTFPPITKADLNSVWPDMPNGTGWYVHDPLPTATYEIVFKINGALRKVTTTAYP